MREPLGLTPPRLRRGWAVTGRAIAVIVVFGLLTLSYASSLRVYFSQQAELARTRQEIATRSARVGELRDRLHRWENDDYVRAQARARLGWVSPGETGYVVLGPDGKPMPDSAHLAAQERAEQAPIPWYGRLVDSLMAADKPRATKPGVDDETTPATPSPAASAAPSTRR